MGAVSNYGLSLFGVGPDGNKKRIKDVQAQTRERAMLVHDAQTPPTIPELPKTPDGLSAAGKAVSAYRRKARSNQGYTSTLLTGPGGAPPVPTVKKSLLGV